jgi:hypothetical protein
MLSRPPEKIPRALLFFTLFTPNKKEPGGVRPLASRLTILLPMS